MALENEGLDSSTQIATMKTPQAEASYPQLEAANFGKCFGALIHDL
jgi:hypothetical protein